MKYHCRWPRKEPAPCSFLGASAYSTCCAAQCANWWAGRHGDLHKAHGSFSTCQCGRTYRIHCSSLSFHDLVLRCAAAFCSHGHFGGVLAVAACRLKFRGLAGERTRSHGPTTAPRRQIVAPPEQQRAQCRGARHYRCDAGGSYGQRPLCRVLTGLLLAQVCLCLLSPPHPLRGELRLSPLQPNEGVEAFTSAKCMSYALPPLERSMPVLRPANPAAKPKHAQGLGALNPFRLVQERQL